MREIKFRAFLKNEGYIVDVLSIDFESKLINHENIQTDNLLSTEPDSIVDPICFTEFKDIELMQFTGLKDKNRKDIYEGDIVLFEDGTKMKILWSDELAKFYAKYYHMGESFSHPMSANLLFKVIGNIPENPELMESGK